VLALHKGFDIFVMSSVTEGLGSSVLDAMACGRSVVATQVVGLPKIVTPRETGLLVAARDPASLAEAIIELLQDRALRERYGNAAVERVANDSVPPGCSTRRSRCIGVWHTHPA
jgi:glycosyltransferase involved in cell wall biosynthesis